MSSIPSKRLQEWLMNVDFELIRTTPLIRTVEFLCGRGNFGYAELGDDYRAIWSYGALASWIPLGVNVCLHTDLFFGLEKELLDLQDEHGHCITLPRIGIPGVEDRADKISIEIYWDDRAETYHVVIHRLVAESEVELELLKQIRARRLAEENFQTTRETLARKQMLLDIIMEHLPVSAAIFNRDKRFLFLTRRWARDFRIECEPPHGQQLIEACPEIPAVQQKIFEKTMAGLTTSSHLDALDSSITGVASHRWTHRLWQHPEDDTGGVLTTVEDVSELARQNHDLKLANGQLCTANRQLAHFASIIAHDLSGPLRSLKATLDGNDEPQNRPGTALASAVQEHIDRMESILASMNDYMQVLCFEPTARSVNIEKLVRDIIKTLQRGNAFELTFSLEVDAPTVNPGMLDLVVRNLIENSIKHHDRESGHLKIAVQDKNEAWLLSLEDDGPGISTSHQQALFGGRAEDMFANGTGGKGLAIVVRALSGIGGTLRIESDPSKARGTRFLIYWPKQAALTASAV